MTDADRKDMHRFVNRLRILRSIDLWDLSAPLWSHVPLWSHRAQMDFRNAPDTYFIRCSDDQRADLWRIIREREGGND